jgi:epoxyqueuosine reductase QueG
VDLTDRPGGVSVIVAARLPDGLHNVLASEIALAILRDGDAEAFLGRMKVGPDAEAISRRSRRRLCVAYVLSVRMDYPGAVMTLAEQVKAVGTRAGARVVGIAAVEAFREKVPEGYRPEDILSGARSVVVAGGDGPTAGAWRSPDHRVMEITGYDLRENVAVHAMCDFIEGTLAHHAIQAPSLPVHGHEPPMSMMHAAELAGLGTRSLAAHIILNPEYGLLYYAALITTLPLEPDQPLAEPACPHPGCAAMYKRIGTTPCLRVCPACLAGTVQDGHIQQSTYDREKCHSRAQTYGIGSFQKGLLQIVNEDNPERRRTMIYSDFFTKSIQSLGFFRDSIAQCFECMRVCPVGRKYRKLQ